MTDTAPGAARAVPDTSVPAGAGRRSTSRGGIRGFVRRNSDTLWLELIGGVILALAVSLVMFWLDQVRTDERDAKDEALSNSIFVRQAVMSDSTVLPFSALYLEGAQLSGLDLAGADFSDADLTAAEIKNADLSGAQLAEADLSGADLSGSDLTGTDLTEATLDQTDVSGADFTGANLTEVDLSQALFVDGAPPVGVSDLDALQVVAESDTDD